MNIKIELNISQTEYVSSALIDKLYRIAILSEQTNEDNINNINLTLKGSIAPPAAYGDAVDYLNAKFNPDFKIDVSEDNKYIRFVDDAVKNVLINKVGDGIGITKKQALDLTIFGSNWDNSWFSNNKNITNFPELKLFGVTTIVEGMFRYCSNLESIDCSNITVVRSCAFLQSGLKTLDLPKLMLIDGHPFDESTKLELITSLGVISLIPNFATGNTGAFSSCINLKRVNIPSTIVYIGGCSFAFCSNLYDLGEEIKFELINFIGRRAFYCCSLILKEVYMPLISNLNQNCLSGATINHFYLPNYNNTTTATSIDSGDFAGGTYNGDRRFTCSILYFKSITDLHPGSFYRSSISKIVINNNIPPKLHNLFQSGVELEDSLATGDKYKTSVFRNSSGYIQSMIYVPDLAVDSYKNADGWEVISSQIRPMSELNVKPKSEWDLLSESEKQNTLIQEYMN